MKRETNLGWIVSLFVLLAIFLVTSCGEEIKVKVTGGAEINHKVLIDVTFCERMKIQPEKYERCIFKALEAVTGLSKRSCAK